MFRKVALIFLMLAVAFSCASASVTVIPARGDNVIAGGVRSVFSSVTGEADNTVAWSCSGGTLVTTDNGWTEWTAPLTPGDYTVTATTTTDNTASATFTVSQPTVRIDNLPLHIVLYKNQPQIIQAIIWGTVNLGVTWDNTGGTLRGTGREVVFQSSVAGTFQVTSTSAADNTKSSTTTIVVTDNAYPATATASNTEPVDCTHVGAGTEYNVTDETTFDAVPWTSLGAGDTVRIAYGTYNRQILISTSGSATDPIRVCGVRADNGALPILDGDEAYAPPGVNFNSGYSLQSFGGVQTYDAGMSYSPDGETYPKYITIEGLRLLNFDGTHQFHDMYNDNTLTAYGAGAGCFRTQHGGYITLRGMDIAGCGNGITTMVNGFREQLMTRNLLIQGNRFIGNGVNASESRHQAYVQVVGGAVQGNRFDERRTGALGSQLKMRSIQTPVRYNYISSGARLIDSVETQDNPSYVNPWRVDHDADNPVTAADVIGYREQNNDRYVYGNILYNTVAGNIVHIGSDTNGQPYNSAGTFFFYHNTIRHVTSTFTTHIFDGSLDQYALSATLDDSGGHTIADHAVWPTVRASNNAIFGDWSAGGGTFNWNHYSPERVFLDKNWASEGMTARTYLYTTGACALVGGVTPCSWQWGSLNTHIYWADNNVTGAAIPFDTTEYAPLDESALIGAAGSLPTKASIMPPLMQYSPNTSMMTARTTTNDLGAVESGADVTPSAFSYTNVTNAALSTETTTDPCITVAGIDAGQAPAVTISGTGCTYNVDGAAYTADAGTVGLDNVVCLRGTSSGSYSTTYPSCTLAIGGVNGTWTVRTLDAVSDPVAPRMRAGSMSGGWK